jgi:hypothetical protein
VTDDIVIGQVTTALLTAPAILVAHELGLFATLEYGAGLADVCSRLSLPERAGDALLLTAVAARLAVRRGDRYALSEAGTAYLLRTSPTSWCAYLGYLVAHPRLFSYEGVREALVTDRPEAGDDLFETHRHDDARALRFTRWMHSVSTGPAGAWPDAIDLSGARRMLDIAGGSGAHAICAARRWPQLGTVVLDLPNVCRVADEYLRAAGSTRAPAPRRSTCGATRIPTQTPTSTRRCSTTGRSTSAGSSPPRAARRSRAAAASSSTNCSTTTTSAARCAPRPSTC